MTTVEIVAGSLNPYNDKKLVTYLLRYPRVVHCELLTHKMLAKNASSCLSGDTIITIESPHLLKKGIKRKHTSMTIKDIVTKWFEGDSKGRKMQERIKGMYIRTLNEDSGEFITSHITNCFKQGVQTVYEITLENGYKLKCTENHRIFSEIGWITLKEFGLSVNNNIVSYNKNIPKISTNGTKFDLNVFIKGKNENKSLIEICKEQGLISKAAGAFCRRNGLHFSRRKIINETKEYLDYNWLLARKQEKRTNGNIATLCNTTEDRVKKACKKFNIRGFIGTLLSNNLKRSSWNKGKTYHLPESSLVNVRISANKRRKPNSYKNYKDFEIKLTRFLTESRIEVMKKYNYKCALTGSGTELELHHIDPVWHNKDKAFDITNLIPISKKIHRFIHSKNLDLELMLWIQNKKNLKDFLNLHENLVILAKDINKPRIRGNRLVQKFVAITKIELIGTEETYDIEVSGIYKNFIANGIVVHNSRAKPISVMLKEIEEDPFIPSFWQRNHKGMQGTSYITAPNHIDNCRRLWLEARDRAVEVVKKLSSEENVTKQLCNRLLEPFSYIEVLVTGTEFANFFELRCPQYELIHSKWTEYYIASYSKSKKDFEAEVGKKINELNLDYNSFIDQILTKGYEHINKGMAEIHLMDLAEKMWDAYNEYDFKMLKPGEWHLPLVNLDEKMSNEIHDYGIMKLDNVYDFDNLAASVSSARAARGSYGKWEGKTIEEDILLGKKLFTDKHLSPFLHPAKCPSPIEYSLYSDTKFIKKDIANIPQIEYGWFSEYHGFMSYRYMMERGLI